MLNDSSFSRQPESSEALGFGFRCGFLGLLHMEIVQERLERESGIDVVQTAPTVTYQVLKKDGEVIEIDSPAHLPNLMYVEEIREPMVEAALILPSEYMGPTMKLLDEKRGIFEKTEYLSPTRVQLTCAIPLAEIIIDFYDKLKSCTRGFGTLDYTYREHLAGDLVKLNILVGGEPVDALFDHRSPIRRRTSGASASQTAQASHPSTPLPGAIAGCHRGTRGGARDHQGAV